MQEEFNCVVYEHISPSGKHYIGITKRKAEVRWNNGKGYESCTLFHNAIKKYGWENFQHKIILENISKSEAIYAEKYLIKWYKTHNLSYNLTDGGDGTLGIQRFGEENFFYGKHHTQFSKELISQAQKGENNSMYGKECPNAIYIEGKRLQEYAEEYQVPYTIFYNYYIKHNRDISITIEYYKNNPYKPKEKQIGKSLSSIAKELNIPYTTFRRYYNKFNKNLEETINYFKSK